MMPSSRYEVKSPHWRRFDAGDYTFQIERRMSILQPGLALLKII
jgi:hypothetical protein